MPVRGSCHCGRIAYSLDAEPTEAIECNCSICRRRGSVLTAFAPDQFHLETSRDDIATYTFGRHVIRHRFCRTCGCAPFAEGTGPDGKAMVVVNLRCVENVDLSKIRIAQFDGASFRPAGRACMSTTHRGGCRCGAIRYEIAAEPMFAGQCQCLECQHETGGGHSSFIAFPAGAVKLTGTPRFYEVQADSGNTMRRGFCPACGSPVVAATSGLPDVTTITAGSLEDPSIFKPQFVCYTSRGHAWDSIDPALPSFPKMPPMPDDAEQPARST